MGETGLDLGLQPLALVDCLAIIHVELVQVGDLVPGDAGDMDVLEAMQLGQHTGKTFSLFWCKALINVRHMNRPLTFLLATTVAKGLADSGEIGRKELRHHCHPNSATATDQSIYRARTTAAAIPSPCNARHGHCTPVAAPDLADRFLHRFSLYLFRCRSGRRG
jgi:hypothetical protein